MATASPWSPSPPPATTRAPASPTGPSPASAPARSASPGRPPATPTPSSGTSSAAAWTTRLVSTRTARGWCRDVPLPRRRRGLPRLLRRRASGRTDLGEFGEVLLAGRAGREQDEHPGWRTALVGEGVYPALRD